MIKKVLLIFIFTYTLTNSIRAQEIITFTDSLINNSNYSTILKISLMPDEECHLAKELALFDIENDQIKLFIVGGIEPIIYTNQKRFERKYKLEYCDFGCLPPEFSCLINYNSVIFNFLDEKYGPKWRKKIRPDVEGLNGLVN